MQQIKSIIDLIRVRQWHKNLCTFTAPFFAGRIFDTEIIYYETLAFLTFCFFSSCVYIVNDICDIEQDQSHPLKSKRPLASGKLSLRQAYLTLALLFPLALCLAWLTNSQNFVWIVACYVLMNLAYTAIVKTIAVFDISLIALGFVMRVIGGGAVVSIETSNWLILMIFALAMLIALGKRRDELVNLNEQKDISRKSLTGYNLYLIDALLMLSLSVVLICYIMYCFSKEGEMSKSQFDTFFVSILFVFLSIARYLQLTLIYHKSEFPAEILLRDRPILLLGACWLLIQVYVLYLS